MNIKLLGARILIKAKDEETKTESGLIVPTKNERGDILLGTVVAVGSGKKTEATRVHLGVRITDYVPLDVKVGDKEIFQYGVPISVEGKAYLLVTEEDV